MKDIYQSVTDRVIAELEQGVAPWIKPWSGETDPFPRNLASGHHYRGVNILILTMEANARGYTSNEWLTFRQALELGGHVRKGETASQIVFYQLKTVESDASKPVIDADEGESRTFPVLKVFSVFNRDQVDGLLQPTPSETLMDWIFTPCELAEQILLCSGADIRHQGFRAFYSPVSDRIYLPQKLHFTDEASYYATALHELTHWTSHPTRLDPKLGKRFGDASYAMEELIAEMGSAYLSAHCRIDGQLQHASYIGSWLDVLHRDKKALFIAAGKAQQSADYLLQRAGRADEERLSQVA
jgi:antirestriction protein ArdC